MSHSRLVNDVCVGQNEEAGGNFLCKKRQIIPENEFRDVGESSDHIIDHRIENYEHCVSVISHSLSLDGKKEFGWLTQTVNTIPLLTLDCLQCS
jgi:hypothetical protein